MLLDLFSNPLTYLTVLLSNLEVHGSEREENNYFYNIYF